MLRFSGSSQNPGSSVLDELQLSNGLLWKVGEETITIIHPAADKGMNKFLQVLTGNKTSNSCNVFEMIVCWFSDCFDMTTKAYTHTHTHTHTHWITCFTGTLHRRNGLYTVQNIFSIPLLLYPLNYSPQIFLHFLIFKKLNSAWFLSLFPHGDQKNSPRGPYLLPFPSLWGHLVSIM